MGFAQPSFPLENPLNGQTMPDSMPLRSVPTGLTIRMATPGDMAAVAAIYSHYVETSAATFEVVPPAPDDMARRYEDVMAQSLPYLVAEQENQLVGYAYAGLYRTRSAYRHTVEDSVYVDKDSLGQGIGRHLLWDLITRCTALGYRQMIAVIGDSANSPSIALHSQLGFKVIGALPATGRKFERWVDTVLMQRPLGDGGATPPSHAASS